MFPHDGPSAFPTLDRPDYVPPPPRSVELKARVGWWRAGLLASLLFAPPLVLYLGEMKAAEWRALMEKGRTTTGSIPRRG